MENQILLSISLGEFETLQKNWIKDVLTEKITDVLNDYQISTIISGGMSSGELNIFAGVTGSGKSLFMQNIALDLVMAKEDKTL